MSLAEVIQGVDSFLSDSPINMVKWGSVFVVIIIGYIVLIKSKIIMKIVMKWEYKRDIAISRNHVVEAKLISEYPYGEAPNYEWHAKYSYVVDGKKLNHTAIFNDPARPPQILKLYYVNSPKRVFSEEEYIPKPLDGILVIVLVLLPFVAGTFTAILLRL